jgi:holin (3TMs family)
MSFIAALLPIIGEIGKNIAGSIFPNPEDQLRREEIQQKLQVAVLEKAGAMEQIAGDIVKTEASSSHWLAANWRPLTALIFVGLIVARWFGYTAPGMTEAEYLSVYDLVKIMIGGYVLSRGAEKIIPSVMDKMGRK